MGSAIRQEPSWGPCFAPVCLSLAQLSVCLSPALLSASLSSGQLSVRVRAPARDERNRCIAAVSTLARSLPTPIVERALRCRRSASLRTMPDVAHDDA